MPGLRFGAVGGAQLQVEAGDDLDPRAGLDTQLTVARLRGDVDEDVRAVAAAVMVNNY